MKIRSQRRCFDGDLKFITHHSKSCHGDMNLAVYLPPQVKDEICHSVYFLSGLTCTDENFVMKSGALRVASELGLILVAPDTSPRRGKPNEEGASFYVGDMFDYVAYELPDFIDAHFPTQSRSIMGHSMGGHGAMIIGLREPMRFQSISAFSPIVAPSQCPWGQAAFTRLLGPDPKNWAQYDTCQLISNGIAAKPIYIDQGSADKFLETQLMTYKLMELAKQQQFPVEVMFHEGYDHSYYFVSTFIENHLRLHARRESRP